MLHPTRIAETPAAETNQPIVLFLRVPYYKCIVEEHRAP